MRRRPSRKPADHLLAEITAAAAAGDTERLEAARRAALHDATDRRIGAVPLEIPDDDGDAA
jgi:hypothetical protein